MWFEGPTKHRIKMDPNINNIEKVPRYCPPLKLRWSNISYLRALKKNSSYLNNNYLQFSEGREWGHVFN